MAQAKNISWTDEELQRLAVAVQAFVDEQGLHKLPALLRAQSALLPAERRKHVASWGAVAKEMDPLLQAAKRALTRPAPVVAPALDESAPATPAKSEDGAASAPRVLVAGLLACQQQEVRSALAAFDLRFWGVEESGARLREQARACELAVGVTKFLNHAADGVLKSLAPRYVRHAGGISGLKDTLLREVAELPRT